MLCRNSMLFLRSGADVWNFDCGWSNIDKAGEGGGGGWLKVCPCGGFWAEGCVWVWNGGRGGFGDIWICCCSNAGGGGGSICGRGCCIKKDGDGGGGNGSWYTCCWMGILTDE